MTPHSLISRTWAISDIDGRDKRTVTLVEYLAEVAVAKARVEPVADALYRGDHDGCAAAQNALSVDAKFAALRAALG